MTEQHNGSAWQDYTTLHHGPQHTVVGDLRIRPDFWSPQLQNHRPVTVLLPPSYHRTEQPYPVIYMHDGQNLFDQATSYAGEWQVDETMQQLSAEGLAAIIVGVANAGEDRLREYSPFPDRRHGGGDGDRYLAFLVETLKPQIDADFRTLTGREGTGILGSSLGGLISLYAFFRYPEIFGFTGLMSPSVWFGRPAMSRFLRSSPFVPGKIYLDTGSHEYISSLSDRLLLRLRSRRYNAVVRLLYQLLQEMGYVDGRDLCYREEKGGMHNEAAWARRLPAALRFLLS